MAAMCQTQGRFTKSDWQKPLDKWMDTLPKRSAVLNEVVYEIYIEKVTFPEP